MNKRNVNVSFILIAILISKGFGITIINAQPLLDESQEAKIIVTSHKYIKSNGSSYDDLDR
jgi:hypothetical protein